MAFIEANKTNLFGRRESDFKEVSDFYVKMFGGISTNTAKSNEYIWNVQKIRLVSKIWP